MHSLPTHIKALQKALDLMEADGVDRIRAWAGLVVGVAERGGRVLVCGNGGSAAQAQHLTAELVGRYCFDRHPISAIALHAETSSLTAIVNDYGPEALFARQVLAHGRPRDLLVALSTSGGSANVIAAVVTARRIGMRTLALTGRGPNPLSSHVDDALEIDADETATIQELHLVAIHMLCAAVDERLGVVA